MAGHTGHLFLGILLLAVCGLALLLISRWRWARGVRRFTSAARRLAEGDFAPPDGLSTTHPWTGLEQALSEIRRRMIHDATVLERQRETLHALLTQVGEGVIVVRADGRVARVNPAAMRLLNLGPSGRGAAGLIGLTVEECLPQHGLQELVHQARLRRGGAQPDPVNGRPEPREARVQVETPDGPVHLLARISELVLPDPDTVGAEAAGWLLVITDITELSRALQMQIDFVANASHELRTPLSTIRAAVETLLSNEPPPEDPGVLDCLHIIERQATRLSALVSDLLSLARLDSGAVYQPQPVSLGQIRRHLEDRFATQLAARELHWAVETELPPHDTFILQPQLLDLALENLVENAIKFTEPGGRVCLCARRTAGGVEFEVTDTGCGIPEEDQSRVFERFYQVERARAASPLRGTGLGLSIVRQAVAAMGGTVRLHSRLGAGTTVTLRIPQPAPPPAP